MPQGENFWNPYRMIPVRNRIEKKSPATDEKFTGKNGRITCTLKNLTPLFVSKGNTGNPRIFQTRNNRHVIPGSSLKGVLRSLAEIVGGGCFITGSTNRQFAPCEAAHSLCITCRMFGMMERGRNARVHKGNVSIGDAILQDEQATTIMHEVLLGSPAPRHQSFYITPENGRFDRKSRKLYFHQPQVNDKFTQVPNNLKKHAWNVSALAPGHDFEFQILFSNLLPDELNLLTYILVLEEDVQVTIGEENLRLRGPLRHKIGNAKPLGMGSCHIAIKKLEFFEEPSKRFTSLGNAIGTMYEGEDLKQQISEMINNYTQDTSTVMQQLRKMMVWDENDSRVFHYPDYHWFKAQGNSQIELKTV
ncbi:RAMP superfamily CRISPR-associated protein [Desulfobacterales bacterium HSG17]|nr:RAMP superfamily CRISPR-associated protein [Desulfobacterales bacterium HSG17]